MASPISPGVYTTITDLSSYVGVVPSTIGLICGLTKKGEDNTLKFIGGRAEFIAEFGEPNITEYGKNYGQGPYCAYNYLGESGSLFFMRCMPDDASFSNIKIDVNLAPADADASISLSYISSANANSLKEIRTVVATETATMFPLCVLFPIGRGEYYNSLSVNLVAHANPMLSDIYVLDIYENQADGSEVIVESFEVSFDPNVKDSTGDSIWIQYILNNYSSVLRCEMLTDGSETFSEGFNTAVKVYDKEIGTVEPNITIGSASLADSKQDFTDWQSTSMPLMFAVEIKDQRGNVLRGWLGASNDDEVLVYNGRTSGASQSWIGDVDGFDASGEITYRIKKSFSSLSTAFELGPIPLKKGSDGDLLDASGNLNTTTATQLLSQGYLGQLTSKIDGVSPVDDGLDQENVYYSIVFDCGYPSDVKSSISTLVQTRRDCVAIMDNGDNSTVILSLAARNEVNVMNNYFCALYEEYNKVYDSFTGQDIWVSPVYHMSYLIPRNDNVAEIWFAAAGFNRASIDTIKELRFNPRLGQRDQMYLKQLNPIVKFNPGYTNWGQLTTQAKPSALQDLNIVRLVLYVKRALEQYCRYFIFEQNDPITWGQVSNGIVGFLDDIKQRRGLYNYSIDVGANEYEKKTKTFHVNITLEPTRVVEKISLNFFIK